MNIVLIVYNVYWNVYLRRSVLMLKYNKNKSVTYENWSKINKYEYYVLIFVVKHIFSAINEKK